MTVVDTLDTDLLTLTRGDLVLVLDSLEIPHHDYEPLSLGEAPAAWFGRPSLSFDQFEHEVVVTWPLTFAGHPIDPEHSTHEFDRQVWELWNHLGTGRRVMAPDSKRSVTALEARPSTTTVGSLDYPTYDITVRTTVHVGLC